MNNTTCIQALPGPKKVKKKQVKNELDRMKQAEKKKRRLEKALATSAAIRAELEKKKQKKKEEGRVELDEEDAAKRQHEQQVKDELDRIKHAEKKKMRLEKALATSAALRAELEMKKQRRLEEQQRLDEEGAAIAEAVALHVLLGEDSEDPYQILLKDEKDFNPWDYAVNADMLMGGRAECIPHRACRNYTVQGIGFLSNAYGVGNSNWSVPYEPFRREAYEPYSEERGWDRMGLSADLIAAQAVSSLQISENAQVDAIVFDGMFRG